MKKILTSYASLSLLLLACLLSCKKDDIISTNGPPNGGQISQVNKAPVARAGLDKVLFLPDDSVLMNGINSYDPDGTISKYNWELISGPGNSIIEYPDSAVTYIKKLERGEYTFQLTVTDGAGAIGKDVVVVTVIGPVECSVTGLPQAEATLTEVGELSLPQTPRVTVCGSKIFYGGGAHGYGVINMYDVNSKSWYTLQLSQPRANIAMTSSGDKVFFAGGNNYDEFYDMVDIYDVSDGSWSVEHLSERKSAVTAASIGNKVFFAGGITEDGTNQTNLVEIYDTDKKQWSRAYLSEGKINVAAVTANNKVYFAGGFNYLSWGIPDPYYQTVDIYDAVTDTWTRDELKSITGDVTGIVYGDKIYWSGKTRSGSDSKVEVWNTQTGYLSSYCLSYPRSMPGMGAKYDEIVVFTGFSDMPDVPVSNRFDILNPETGSVTLGKMNIAFKGAAVTSVNNEIYIAGGKISYVSEGATRSVNSSKVYLLSWQKNDR